MRRHHAAGIAAGQRHAFTHVRHQPREDVRVGLQRGIAGFGAGAGRIHIGQGKQQHRSVSVLECQRLRRGVETGAQVHAVFLQQPGVQSQPVGAVVVAGDDDDVRRRLARQPGDDLVPQRNGFRRRHCAVEHVAGDDDGIRTGVLGQRHELLQHVSLVVRERNVVENLAEVPVGGMEDAHVLPPVCRFPQQES